MAPAEDTELQELRQRRVRELQQSQAAPTANPQDAYAAAQRADMERREAERQEILRRVFTPEARERLGRLRLAKPDVAQAVEQQVVQLASTGRLGRPVDDAMLRALLERIAPERREVTITRR
ncbi:MAG: DNA-binding protein [Thermoplasmata archaeon]|nr:DNA-binding protein [Thermoplasmata archaeon]